MKRLRVTFAPSARRDLDEIYEYVRDGSGDPQIAQNYVGRIVSRCVAIGDAPFAGVARDDLLSGVRMTGFACRVAIFYRAGTDHVEIVGLFSKGRDYEAILRSSGVSTSPAASGTKPE